MALAISLVTVLALVVVLGPTAFAVLTWGSIALVLAVFAYVGYLVLGAWTA